ncbi:hypothetical protein JDV09_18890 [Mycobacterium sp. Y57]|uniref:hypothetical protein n=1 Tax=Mycolicibacterium xanthum TaxID=2796469 RepID=UPI001C85EBD6|nr:hypothetical protein [Mycolicibacterium xanthum]MBX7434166.1 hypothetical protein [Mycolicibacterium xanthum]
MIDADSVPPMPDDEPAGNGDPDAEFFDATPILKAIADFAWSRYTSRLAVLGCVLRRGIALIPPSVKLPAITGAAASLNFYTVTAGASGQGKDAADGAGFDAVDFFDQQRELFPEARQAGGGSGEGLARIFRGRKGQPPVTAVHVMFNEVSKLGALIDRQGATLESELLAGYMGQRLGAENNSKDTTTVVEPHTYRLCLGVGAQPENADFFLSRERNGFPQRFLWLPASDPWCPQPAGEPARALTPITVALPAFGSGIRFIDVPERIRQEVVECRWRALVDDPGMDPLDGHLMLTRLKVAVGLALLHGGLDVDEGFWWLAGHLMLRSRQTRDQMRTAVEARRRRENTARASARAEAQVIVETRLADARADRVLRAIKRKLAAGGETTEGDLRRCLDSSIRGDFNAVFTVLVDEGLLVSYGTTQKGTIVWGWRRG